MHSKCYGNYFLHMQPTRFTSTGMNEFGLCLQASIIYNYIMLKIKDYTHYKSVSGYNELVLVILCM